jgi:hypothetical protein
MAQRDHHRVSDPRQGRSPTVVPRRTGSPVLALQRLIGNRATTRVLGRKDDPGPGTLENSVRIGKLGLIEISESNIDAWIAKKADVTDLIVTTVEGKHSAELKRMSDSKERIDNIEVVSVTGKNSWVTVTFKNAVIQGYAPDASGKAERWTATGFDAVDIKRTSLGKPRA